MNYTEHAPAAPQTALDPDTADAYLIVVNAEGQHSVWPAALAVPAGWRPVERPMRKDACLAAITAQWPDITPASARGPGPPAGPPDAEPGTDASPAARRGGEPGYVHEAFDEQAARRAACVAVASAAGDLTYRQLNESANQLARHLQDQGVGPETLVGVCLERGPETIRCLLAILKAGGAYLPLDPSLPDARLAQMQEEAGVRFILTRGRTRRAFAGGGALLLPVAELATQIASQPVTAPVTSLRPANLAYAIWTSGSTGHPKAVAVSHGSLAGLCQDVIRGYGLTPGDRVLQLASLAFDTSLEQILSTLLSGATLMVPEAGPVAPTDLVRYVADQRVSVADLTPAYWHQILAGLGPGRPRAGPPPGIPAARDHGRGSGERG